MTDLCVPERALRRKVEKRSHVATTFSMMQCTSGTAERH
jgi:hypothetical protein